MKQNDYRVGNLVHPCSDAKPVSVPLTNVISRIFEIKFEGLQLANDHTKSFAEQDTFLYPYNRVSPIPLTKEWLIKFGFVKHFGGYNNGIQLELYDEDRFILVCDDKTVPTPFVLYVHKIQNLYFELMERELTIINSF